MPVDRTKRVDRKQEKRVSRGERMAADGTAPPMPEVSAEHVVAYWRGAGLVQAGGMGVAALSSAELEAWQRGSAIVLTTWEFGAVRAMSSAYVTQLHEAEDKDCPSPVVVDPGEIDRDAVAKKVRNALRALSGK